MKKKKMKKKKEKIEPNQTPCCSVSHCVNCRAMP